MVNLVARFTQTAILLCVVLATGSYAQNRESANGHGTINVQDADGRTVKRQFSFNARRNNDGSVSGQAILHNASFTGASGRTYQAQFNISCMKVVGNTALLGGFVRRTNDPNLVDVASFIVQDNGEPGKNDRISTVFFFDGDPNTTGSPAGVCDNTPLDAYPLMLIDSGNVQVRSSM